MSGVEDVLLSNNQRIFVLKALLDGLRTDGRFFHEARKARVSLRRYESQTNAEVDLGKTRILAVVTAVLGAPFGDRGNEGTLNFSVTLGPLAGPQHEVSRGSPVTAELARMLERAIRDSRAIDMEALCVVPGAQVWQLRVDVTVTCDDGNLADACSLGAIAALMHFRRPDVTVKDDGAVQTHPFAERPPLALSLHHVPVSVTLGLFTDPIARLKQLDFAAASLAGAAGSSAAAAAAAAAEAAGAGTGSSSSSSSSAIVPGGDAAVLDPSLLEEQVYNGRVTFVMNAHRELCGVHKLGGAPMTPDALLAATKVAGARAQELVAIARGAVATAERQADERDGARIVESAMGGLRAGTLEVPLSAAAAAAGGAGAGAAAAAAAAPR